MKYMTDIEQFYMRRNHRLKKRGKSVRFDYEKDTSAYDWITISGVHTPIDDNGDIAGGKFKGNTYTGDKVQRSAKRSAAIRGVERPKSLKPYGKRSWPFSLGAYNESKNRAAKIYPTKYGVDITVPRSSVHSKQHINPGLVSECFEKIPAKIMKCCPKEIQLVDYRNPKDKHWEERYGIPGFRSFAIGGTDAITYFENFHEVSKYTMMDTLSHEMGHNVDRMISKALGRGDSAADFFSDGDEWKNATDRDRDEIGEKNKWVSGYATESKSYHEDFADSVKMFVVNRKKFKDEFPNRYKLLTEMLEKL